MLKMSSGEGFRLRIVQLSYLEAHLLLGEVWLMLTEVSGSFWVMLTLLDTVVMSGD